MTDRSIGDVVADLDDLLEMEREALLSGNLEVIGRLLQRKESLVEDLSVLDATDADVLAGVAGKLKRNQQLLDQALEGIRSVSARLAVLRRVRENLDTYDANGAKKSIRMMQDGSVEKRA